MPDLHSPLKNRRYLSSVAPFIALYLAFALHSPVKAQSADNSWSLRDKVRCLEPSVVWIIADLGDSHISQGSGFIIHENGYILTAAHVVDGARQIVVGWTQRYQRSEKIAAIVSVDPISDIALLKIDGNHFPSVRIEPSRNANTGDAVIALGYPAGGELGLGGLTVTRGILSCTRTSDDGLPMLLQTDAAVTLGCSGGPLYDLDTGSVIGIIKGKGTYLLEGFNFATPSEAFFNYGGIHNGYEIDTAIENLAGGTDQTYSMPFMRAKESFLSGRDARDRFHWGEALSHFLTASILDNEDPLTAYAIAESYAALACPSQALTWLEHAFELGFIDFQGALNSDGFEKFRNDARFTQLVHSF